MNDRRVTLLLEIGTEELPPKSLHALSDALVAGIRQGLDTSALGAEAVRGFCSPRRLAVLAHGVGARQADREVERKGPSVKAAFDAAGEPTRAALGFARSCGVTVSDLEQTETDKGTWLVYRTVVAGAQRARGRTRTGCARRGRAAAAEAYALGRQGNRIRPPGALGGIDARRRRGRC